MIRLFLIAVALVGCRDDSIHLPSRSLVNAAPHADAGVGGSYRVGTRVLLTAARSFDPDGTIVGFAWRIVSAPMASTTALEGTGAESSALLMDAVGRYQLEVVVMDDAGAMASSEIAFDATPPTLFVNAGLDLTVPWFSPAQLAGVVTPEPGFSATFSWSLETQPAGSSASPSSPMVLAPTFFADVAGTYTFRLTASTGFETISDTVDVTVVAGASNVMALTPMHLEYSLPLERWIAAGEQNLNLAISIVDPVTGAGPVIDTGHYGVFYGGLSLHPNGLRAALADPGVVATVNLQTASVEQLYDVPYNIWSNAFVSDVRVITSPSDASSEALTSLNLSTGGITEFSTFGDGAQIRLHPSSNAFYLVDGGASSAVARFGLATNPPTLERQRTLGGTSMISTPFVFTQDGGSIITGTGAVLFASTNPATDMTYRGSLGVSVAQAAHSTAAHQIAVLSDDLQGNIRLSIFDDATLALLRSGIVPPLAGNPVGWTTGIAFNSAGTQIYLACGTNTGTYTYAVARP